MQMKGLGSWSADVYLLMVLRRPDIFPATDLALITAITELKQLPTRPTPDQLLTHGRSVASLSGRGGENVVAVLSGEGADETLEDEQPRIHAEKRGSDK